MTEDPGNTTTLEVHNKHAHHFRPHNVAFRVGTSAAQTTLRSRTMIADLPPDDFTALVVTYIDTLDVDKNGVL